ncbi:alpha-hydroxy-acid oxidizing protein [Natrarchaeobius halalkaliphilus]|uniref:Alpha-hydroxy-acid oxidizing protein n=1 Tax=Natrarchaeobius halalkaliphilus TaxID=1679091 RepID=A0A3N6M5A0_9EURY|nr:alpha-hydroxy-acid oxidizing protein [Natrarchaeobius halalkaliphilus]RQG87889.1 alpha-hydroxy-acid oxidizing protein [Natrarchaeobius halalkaliphilus]
MTNASESPLERRLREIETERTAVPFDYDELERVALERLPSASASYVAATAGTGETGRANRREFDRWRIVPRVLRDVSDRSLGVDLFEKTLRSPLLLAPIGGQTKYHEDGELASVRAATELGVPFALSTASSYSIEDVAETDDSNLLFQLYCTSDFDTTVNLLERAERAGYDGILLTVDFQVPRWSPETLSRTNDQLYASSLANLSADSPANSVSDTTADPLARDESLSWEDLSALTEATTLPIYLKGITHPEDARLAVEHGMDGVVVSNHGGRQVDGSIAAITALPHVADAVGADVPVLFDSGVRGGADAFKAIALGADAVFLGRPYLYGLTIAGQRGVYEVVHNVLAELDSVVGLSGYDSIANVDRSAIVDGSSIGSMGFD